MCTGAALAWTLTGVLEVGLPGMLEDVPVDVLAGGAGSRFLGGIKVVAVEATLVPVLGATGLEVPKSRRAVPIPCRSKVSGNIWEEAASLECGLPLSLLTSASLRLSWNELAAIFEVPRELPAVAMGESSDRFVSSVVIKMASASGLANARCSPNVLLLRLGGMGYNEFDMNRDFLSGWLNP